jgi:hypothetical protein
MSRAKIVDHYIHKVTEENFDIDQVRKELVWNNVDEDEIRIIVRLVDNEVQRRIVTTSGSKRSTALVGVGLVVTLVGAAITIFTYFGIIDTGNSFVIAYGPFLGGLSILAGGLAGRRRT